MEFDKGKSAEEAALIAAKLRLRPILMTAFAFILGCVPLWAAAGAGAISRQVLEPPSLVACWQPLFWRSFSFRCASMSSKIGSPKKEAFAASIHAAILPAEGD